MLDVLVAELFRGVVFLRIIIAVRHPESALVSLRDHHVAVLVVLAGGETEKRGHSHRVQMRDFFQHILAVLQRIDPLEIVLERFHVRRVDLLLIHSAGVEIAHLLQVRGRGFFDL